MASTVTNSPRVSHFVHFVSRLLPEQPSDDDAEERVGRRTSGERRPNRRGGDLVGSQPSGHRRALNLLASPRPQWVFRPIFRPPSIAASARAAERRRRVGASAASGGRCRPPLAHPFQRDGLPQARPSLGGETSQFEVLNSHRVRRGGRGRAHLRQEAVAGGVRQDVVLSEHHDLAVLNKSVPPTAEKPSLVVIVLSVVTTSREPCSCTNCSDERDRDCVAGARVPVLELLEVEAAWTSAAAGTANAKQRH